MTFVIIFFQDRSFVIILICEIPDLWRLSGAKFTPKSTSLCRLSSACTSPVETKENFAYRSMGRKERKKKKEKKKPQEGSQIAFLTCLPPPLYTLSALSAKAKKNLKIVSLSSLPGIIIIIIWRKQKALCQVEKKQKDVV